MDMLIMTKQIASNLEKKSIMFSVMLSVEIGIIGAIIGINSSISSSWMSLLSSESLHVDDIFIN